MPYYANTIRSAKTHRIGTGETHKKVFSQPYGRFADSITDSTRMFTSNLGASERFHYFLSAFLTLYFANP